MDNALLSISNVSKTYYSKKVVKKALRGITLDIFSKEVISLLGVNGAGKTTLSSIIASLIPPTSGEVLWEGKSIYSDITNYRHIIGFCPQHQNLDDDLDLEENLTFAGRYYNLPKAEIKKRKEELLEKFELEEYAKYEVGKLSGGYRQRFMIARTLMHNPKLVILDEPTVGLDPQIRRQLWKHILELKEEGITILLTTHYLDEADILSDRVCVIDAGEEKIIGSPKDLKNQWKKQNLEDVFLHLIKVQEEKQ